MIILFIILMKKRELRCCLCQPEKNLQAKIMKKNLQKYGQMTFE